VTGKRHKARLHGRLTLSIRDGQEQLDRAARCKKSRDGAYRLTASCPWTVPVEGIRRALAESSKNVYASASRFAQGTQQLIQFDREKFKTLVLYIAWKAGRRDWFGATKLNKILWFAEARAYVLHGAPIAGATYIREKHGPVPKQMMPVRAELEHAGKIRVFKEGQLIRVTADEKPDMTGFSRTELQIVDHWIDYVDREHTAGTISDESHDYAWDIAHMGEEIPLYAILANRIREPNEHELERLKEKAREHGLI
jgi:hypothetical protein